MKPTLLVDIDDTIVDWVNSFVNWMDMEHGRSVDLSTEVGTYNLCAMYNLDVPMIGEYVDSFNQSEHFSRLPFLEGAEETLMDLKSDYSIIAVTSCGIHSKTKTHRYANIGHVVDYIHFLPTRTTKKGVFSFHLEETVFMVDDHKGHVEDAREMGINAHHFAPRKTLQHENSINSWYDIPQIIEDSKCLE